MSCSFLAKLFRANLLLRRRANRAGDITCVFYNYVTADARKARASGQPG
jgi:hypothetical protein